MNEDTDQNRPEQEAEEPVLIPVSPIERNRKLIGYWARRLLVCNPFYLVSAALLLYGCYRISTEPEVSNKDSLHLFFNFGSFQFYELLLVVTAILLARRRIWYDSTLLVGLENMMLIVPFILISQGALIGQQMMEKRLIWGALRGSGNNGCAQNRLREAVDGKP